MGRRSEFLFLNNFDSLSEDIIKSEIGPNIKSYDSNIEIVSSTKFTGDKCLSIPNAVTGIANGLKAVAPVRLKLGGIYTAEAMFSTTYNSSYYGWTIIGLPVCQNQHSIRLYKARWEFKCPSLSDVMYYNGATKDVYDGGGHLFTFIPNLKYDQVTHFASIIDLNEMKIYGFFNGVKMIVSPIEINTSTPSFTIYAYIAEHTTPWKIEMISVREGDFSNNRESFTIPTEKYHR